ncbi:MAG TPA: cation:proton antiporter [Thermoanaerobaculia bacterium]|nr:cation:proton antiporter [Thermoanaerobaculia bacterium]HUM30231.1 cation:proton antiporter [Thermoanaerobaculia bacterium]HXK68473.1 cation:proton antiporter [Thermoanaerobaculia bacterium]
MLLSLIEAILVISGLSLGVLWICHRIRVPSVVGLLLTGILAGPHGLRLVHGIHEVEVLAEIGIIFLLFAIGIEFSFRSFIRGARDLLSGGSLQVVLTTAMGAGILLLAGRSLKTAMVGGLLLALSSTAVVIRLLQDRTELDSSHGRLSVNILIFQDLAAVLVMAAIPLLSGVGGPGGPPLVEFIEGAAMLTVTLVGGWYFFPKLLHQLSMTRNREIFLLGVLFVGFGLSWLAARAGLSPALGAFLAGLLISESDYAHYAIGNILPLRDIFTSLFFISMGMLFQVKVFLHSPLLLLFLAAAITMVKFLIITLIALLLRYPFHTSLLTGLTLAQVGEFSFVVGRLALGNGLIDTSIFDLFLISAILTLLATPFLMAMGPKLAHRVRPGLKAGSSTSREKDVDLIIAGYGAVGQTLTRVARRAGVHFAIIELNPANIRAARKEGYTVLAGDASFSSILQHAGILKADLLAVTLPDNESTRQTVRAARELSPDIPILVRTRYFSEVDTLQRIGATEILVEEEEMAAAMSRKLLSHMNLPQATIETCIQALRGKQEP